MRVEDLINNPQKVQKEIESDPKKIDEFCWYWQIYIGKGWKL